jgi:hypothetical protein
MIVAELQIVTNKGFHESVNHIVRFDVLETADAEYQRVAKLMLDKADRKNELPQMVEVMGASEKVTVPLDTISSVGLVDYAKTNAQMTGLRDAFPNMFKR